jgi:hypothetical protein
LVEREYHNIPTVNADATEVHNQGKSPIFASVSGMTNKIDHMQRRMMAKVMPTQPTITPSGEALVMRIAPHDGQLISSDSIVAAQYGHCMMFPSTSTI